MGEENKDIAKENTDLIEENKETAEAKDPAADGFYEGAAGRVPADIPWHSRGFMDPTRPAGQKWIANICLGGVVAVILLILKLILDAVFKTDSVVATGLMAFVPMALLIVYIFCLDTIEKEPVRVLLMLFFVEAFVAYFAMDDVAKAAQKLELLIFGDTFAFSMANYLVGVLLIQGIAIYGVLKIATWSSGFFDYRFDGIVYATVTSLGFATEEIIYAICKGNGSWYRAFTDIPGHCFDGVLMGIFFGQAKYLEARGKRGRALGLLFLSFLVPSAERILSDFLRDYVFIPGWVFTVYALLRTAVLFVLVLRMAQKDEAIGGAYDTV